MYIRVHIQRREFTWDPIKSDRNLVDRGFDFAFATGIFDAPTLERVDARRNYGEHRRIAIGRTDGVVLTVVFTDRSLPGGYTARRIISARLSNRHERRLYASTCPEV